MEIFRRKIMLKEHEKLEAISKMDIWTPGKIAHHLKKSRSTIQSFLKRYRLRRSIINKTSGGRPKVLDSAQVKRLIAFVKNNPKKSLRDYKEKFAIPLTEVTISKYLKSKGYRRYRQRKKPKLYEPIMKQRLQFARNARRWSLEKWKQFIFSDETSIEEDKKYTSFCWRKKGNSLLNKHIDISRKVYIKKYYKAFGFISWSGVSKLIFKEGKWNNREYIRILEESNLKLIGRNKFFVHDNDTVANSHNVERWFATNKIKKQSIPPYSNDINIIEPVWFELKKKLYKLNLRGNQLKEKAKEIFENISLEYIKKLYSSLPNRIEKIIMTKGALTKYY